MMQQGCLHARTACCSLPRIALARPNVHITRATYQAQNAAARDRQQLIQRLNEMLCQEGIEVKTRRARVRPLKVLHVTSARANHSAIRGNPRCTGLDMDILWEGEQLSTPRPEEQVPTLVQGLARVKLFKGVDNCDRVLVTDIQVMGESDGTAPAMPSTKPAPADLMLAVQSMDSIIMENLNNFMWELEQGQSFALSSFDWDDEEEGEEENDTKASYSYSNKANKAADQKQH